MARNLQDMVVVITGASSGIGRALAMELHQRRARLVLSARRREKLEELNRTLGGGHVCVRADVSQAADCESLIAKTIESFGRIDTLVCNAGYGMARSVAETSREEFERMFATNVSGTVDCIRAAVPIMARQQLRDGWRGQIMIVSSAAARRGLPFFGVYSATKAAQLSLAEALRVELRPLRIAVSSVHPIGTQTDFFTFAEREGGMKMPPKGWLEVRQKASTVGRKMADAIARPRPEVWPLRIARWGLGIAAMMPRVVDRVMDSYRGDFSRINPTSETTSER